MPDPSKEPRTIKWRDVVPYVLLVIMSILTVIAYVRYPESFMYH